MKCSKTDFFCKNLGISTLPLSIKIHPHDLLKLKYFRKHICLRVIYKAQSKQVSNPSKISSGTACEGNCLWSGEILSAAGTFCSPVQKFQALILCLSGWVSFMIQGPRSYRQKWDTAIVTSSAFIFQGTSNQTCMSQRQRGPPSPHQRQQHLQGHRLAEPHTHTHTQTILRPWPERRAQSSQILKTEKWNTLCRKMVAQEQPNLEGIINKKTDTKMLDT